MATELEVIDYALMAGASYISTRQDPNKFPVPDTWTEQKIRRALEPSGFEATAFTKGSNQLVISFAGTYDLDITGDIAADVGLAAGVGSIQLLQAAKYYLDLKNSSQYKDYSITLTGHSLGGGLAALVGVLFGVTTIAFDQAPFAKSARTGLTSDVATQLKTDLLASGYTVDQLTGLTNYLSLRQTNGGIPNSGLVTNYRVDGEFLSGILPFSALDTIGNPATVLQHGPSSDLVGLDLHAQSLLAAILQSNQTGTTNASTGVKESFQQVTYKFADLLNLIFDKRMYAYRTDDERENFLERLVRHQAGVGATATSTAIPADRMVERFTSDLWKLAQDDGMTMNDGNLGNPALHQVSNALIAFAMQAYYENTANAINPNKQLFTNLSTASEGSGGIRFDITDVSQELQKAIGKGDPFALDKELKGFALYFKKYLATSAFTDDERVLINGLLPWLRDWTIQAGTSGMTATDTQNRGAFLLGGNGSDVGGAGRLLRSTPKNPERFRSACKPCRQQSTANDRIADLERSAA